MAGRRHVNGVFMKDNRVVVGERYTGNRFLLQRWLFFRVTPNRPGYPLHAIY